ncbi:MAG: 5-formyltetrahydrofolate cyclo-ligase [Christensenellales bacterium]|jgi:5-formyltetrahydrofolate cyclo-ligase
MIKSLFDLHSSGAFVRAEKRRIRALLLDKRISMTPGDVLHFTSQAIDHLQQLPVYRAARCLFVYVSCGNEVGTHALIRRAREDGKKVGVPLCLDKGEMVCCGIASLSALCPGRRGILEPVDRTGEIQPEEIDLAVVPGVAFDETGSRLGQGGGYYDRFLPTIRHACRIGLCYEWQVLKKLPTEKHDEKMDYIVHQERAIRMADAGC